VWLSEVAALRDASQVAATVAKAMGHHDPLAEAGGPALVLDRLGAVIGRGRVLLVLDNCEHLIEAAADLVRGLLGNCPRLVVLATGRQSLGVAGERLVEVGSLDLPAGDDVASVAGSGAGALFLERAQAVHPRFQVDPLTAAKVAEVCRRLEGLPLAIELAAARARLLTVAQIGERLEETLGLLAGGRGGVERHQTMRAALAWSYDLLGEAERELFRRLAVFRSSFILEAAAAVAPAVSDDILDVLGGLVDQSLVTVVDGAAGQRRFRLLEPVRQFAVELLETSGERDDAAGRHRDHLRSRLRSHGPVSAPGSAAYEGLAVEVDNLRAAVQYSLRASEPEAALDLIRRYLVWWTDKGLLDEQLDLLNAALGAADPARMSVGVRADALNQASTTSTFLGRLDAAVAFVDQLADLRDQHPEALAVRASWAFAQAVATLYRAGGDRLEGNRLMRESRHAWEARGRPVAALTPIYNIMLAGILWDSVDDPEVARAIREGTLLAKRTGALNVAAHVDVLGGVIRVMEGASTTYPACLDAFAEFDALDGGFLVEWAGLCVGAAGELVGDHPTATGHALRWVRYCRRSGVRLMLPCGIRAAARLSVRAGHPEQALRLWGGAEQTEIVTDMRYMPLMQRLDRPLLQQGTDALGPDAARLLAEGASQSIAELTQAAEEALFELAADESGLEPRGMPDAPPSGK
jgi:predicted ATPase